MGRQIGVVRDRRRLCHRLGTAAGARRPSEAELRVPLDWFPWGLAPVSPRRFLLVSDARTLACDPTSGATLGDIGVRSCLHLPILERQRNIGALHLYWSEPRLVWDDDRGRLLRLLGRFLLGRRSRRRIRSAGPELTSAEHHHPLLDGARTEHDVA